jgi:hypothetical protein
MSSERAPRLPGLCQETVASNASITVNNGSVNIAAEGDTGDLWFFWEDNSGAFHQGNHGHRCQPVVTTPRLGDAPASQGVRT